MPSNLLGTSQLKCFSWASLLLHCPSTGMEIAGRNDNVHFKTKHMMMMRWWWWWWWLYDDDDDDVCVCVCLSDRPIMSESYVRMAVDADQSAELSCSARGWPTPTMTWSRNSTSPSDFSSEKSVTGRHDTGEQYPFVSVLNISSVQLHDLGIYTCTAQNNMGVDVTYFNLSVRSKLHITPFVCCEGCIMNWACCYVANIDQPYDFLL